MDNFNSYINPELKRYILQRFSDVDGFEVHSSYGAIVLTIPLLQPRTYDQNYEYVAVRVTVKPKEYSIEKLIKDKRLSPNQKINYNNLQSSSGGEDLLLPKHIQILPTVIKNIQADLRGEKNVFNPAKPVSNPEPEPVNVEPQSTPKTGIFNKFKNKLGFNENKV